MDIIIAANAEKKIDETKVWALGGYTQMRVGKLKNVAVGEYVPETKKTNRSFKTVSFLVMAWGQETRTVAQLFSILLYFF